MFFISIFKLMIVLSFGIFLLSSTGCGPKAFTKGEYGDPTQVKLLDDRFNEADMQQMADSIVKAMVSCPYIANAKQPPVVIVERVQNRTEDHIDMMALTNMVRSSLTQTRKVRFVKKEERGTLDEEYQYNESGYVSGPTQKKKGSQIGADYIMSGALHTNVQQVGNDKLIYYFITMDLTNMETSIIDCTDKYELRKQFKKRRI